MILLQKNAVFFYYYINNLFICELNHKLIKIKDWKTYQILFSPDLTLRFLLYFLIFVYKNKKKIMKIF
jgi:hypothetical protein